MPVDTSIYNLANKPAQFGPDLQQIITLQNLAQQMQARKLIMDQEQQGQNALRQVFSNPESINAQGLPTPNALAQIGRASPDAYMELLPKVGQAQHQQALAQFQQSKTAQNWMDSRYKHASAAVATFDEVARTQGEAAARKAAQEVWAEGLRADTDSGLYPPNLVQSVPKEFPQDVAGLRAKLAGYQASQVKPETLAQQQHNVIEQNRLQLDIDKYKQSQFRGALEKPEDVEVPQPDGSKKVVAGAWDRDNRVFVSTDGTSTPLPGAVPVGKGRTAGKTDLASAKEVTVINDKGDPVESAAVVDDPSSPSGLKHLGTNEPVVIPPGGKIQEGKIAGVATGRQLAQQNLTIIGSGAQVSAALHNLTNLPFSGNIGWLKGIGAQAPEGITDAIRKSLAGEVTSRDARAFQLSWQGVSRALSQLETFGARTGLVGLTKQAETLMPQPGDTTTNVLRSYAELRQIVEQALQTTRSSPGITPQMQGQIDDILGRTRKAVPFTVEDVQNLEDAKTGTRSQRDEKISQFADRMFKTRVTASADPEEANRQWAEAKPGTVFVDQHGNEYTK